MSEKFVSPLDPSKYNSPFYITRFLNNPSKDIDLRKWAAEGLAYLTLDADVKEDLVNDTAAVKSLIDLARVRSEPPPPLSCFK